MLLQDGQDVRLHFECVPPNHNHSTLVTLYWAASGKMTSEEDEHSARSSVGRRRKTSGSLDGTPYSDSDADDAHVAPRQPSLVCAMESVKLLVTLLSCLTPSKKEQRVRCDVDAHGMLFTAHSKGKSLQIKTSIGSDLFESFALVNDPSGVDDDEEAQLSFALNASTLVECLSMFGPSALATTSLRMTYAPEVGLAVFGLKWRCLV